MVERQYTADDDPLTYQVIGCAIAVHKELGPGLRESAYEECLAKKLSDSGLSIQRQPRIGISFEGTTLNKEYRPDFIINSEVVVEVKSVPGFFPVHQAQLLTYMKLANIERGLLINFNVALLRHGIKRLLMTKAPLSASVE
jgi:GxxExxY protein